MKSSMTPPRMFVWPRALAIALAGFSGAALAQAATQVMPGMPIVYPAKGQSPQQQDQDKYQCYGWSREQSGFDPMQAAPAQQAAPSPSTQQQAAAAPTGSGTGGGLVKGAAMGAAVGELAHNDAGRGAAAGALGGVALQNIKQRQAAQARQQQAQAARQQQAQQQAQQQTARQQQKATFDRAFGACMEARGYAVK